MSLTPEQAAVRTAFLTSPKPKVVLVEHNGAKLEVRQPTLGVRNDIHRQARVEVDADEDEKPKKKKGKVNLQFDLGRMQIAAVVACTFFPGTDSKVFNDLDLPALEGALAGGGIDKLVTASMEMLNVKQELIEKNSAATPS
jgi:hypothetical protein